MYYNANIVSSLGGVLECHPEARTSNPPMRGWLGSTTLAPSFLYCIEHCDASVLFPPTYHRCQRFMWIHLQDCSLFLSHQIKWRQKPTTKRCETCFNTLYTAASIPSDKHSPPASCDIIKSQQTLLTFWEDKSRRTDYYDDWLLFCTFWITCKLCPNKHRHARERAGSTTMKTCDHPRATYEHWIRTHPLWDVKTRKPARRIGESAGTSRWNTNSHSYNIFDILSRYCVQKQRCLISSISP
jgi:hypothetical protein